MGMEARGWSLGTGLNYRDFVALERSSLESEETQAYWNERLSGIEVLQLPRLPEASRSAGPGTLGVESVPLGEELAEGLKSLAARAGVPLKSVLLAAHVRVMSLVGNQQDVLTGLVANSRPEESDGERVVGLFLNTLPFPLRPGRRHVAGTLPRRIPAEQSLLPHRRYPWAHAAERGGQPLFETAFNYNHFHVYQGLAGLDGVEVDEPEIFEYTNFTLMANFDLDPASSELAYG